MKKIGYYLLVGLLLIPLNAFNQGHRIEIRVKGLPDTTLLLAYHYGNKKFISDTLFTNSKEQAIAQGDDLLPGGVYLVVMPNMNYFEMLVSDNQKFSVEADTSDLIGTLRFKGSPENSAFLDYQRLAVQVNKENQILRGQMAALKDKPDSLKIVKNKLAENDEKTKQYLTKLTEKFPGSFLTDLINAMTPPEIPDFNLPETLPESDSLKMAKTYHFLRDHYFDKVNFSDANLIRTPILHSKLDQYFNRILIQNPDSVMPQVEKVVKKSKANDEMFQYIVIFCLNNFLESKIMGMDEVFVRVADKYYLSGEAPWADSAYLTILKDRVNKIRFNLIGEKARDLKMETVTGEWVDLYEVEAKYIVLYFWEPNCGFCKKATPKLHKLYEQYKEKGLEVFAVDTQDNREEWEKYINDHSLEWINAWDPHQTTYFRYFYDVYSTPTIYLLDNRKVIVAKRIDVEQLQRMIEGLMNASKP